MFGFPVVAAGACATHVESQPWHVDDADLNAWGEANLDDYAKAALVGETPELRKKAMFITRSKAMKGACSNPSPYIGGIIRREKEQNPYARPSTADARASPAPLMQGPPLTARTVASPQHAAAAAPRVVPAKPASDVPPPLWVTSALNAHQSRSALMRTVAAHVPAAAMDAIAKLPSSFMTACVLSMLICPDGYTQPEAYMTWFAGQCHAVMPNGLRSICSTASTTSNAKKLAVIAFGPISGCEWIGVGLATQQLSENQQIVQVVERLTFSQPSRWQSVLDEVSHNLTPQTPYQQAAPAEAVQVLTTKVQQWCSQGVSILALIMGPQPVSTMTFPGASLPGFHAACASDFWLYCRGLKVLTTHCPSVMIAHFAAKATEAPEDAHGLTQLFGKPWTMDHSHLRVPQQQFCVRRRPATQWESSSAPRALHKTQAAERLHRELGAIYASGAPFEVQLPPVGVIEDALEKKAENMRMSPEEQKALSWITAVSASASAAAACDERLLDRKALAAVFGLEQWTFLDHWAKKMPCAGLINSITGIPVGVDHPEAVECCKGRWCTSCCELYDCLVTCPSPHLVHEVVARLLRDGLFADRGQWVNQPMRAAEVPEHTCNVPCNGLIN